MTNATIIVPLYNKAASLRATINSALAQDVEGLEVLVVDDGSTDGSGELADELASDARNVRVVHRTNGGLAAARNTGLDHASGAYIHFLDADDSLPSGAIRALLEAERRHDLGGAVGAHEVIDPQGAPLERHEMTVRSVGLDDLIDRTGFVVHQPITTRDAIGPVRFDETRRGYEDVDFWLRVAERGVRWAVTPHLTATYVMHPGSMSKDSGLMSREVAEVLDNLLERQSRIHPLHRIAHITADRIAHRKLHFALTYASQAAAIGEDDPAAVLIDAGELPPFTPRDAALRAKQSLVYGLGIPARAPDPRLDAPLRRFRELWNRCEAIGIVGPGFSRYAERLLLNVLVDPDLVARHLVERAASMSGRVTLIGFGQKGVCVLEHALDADLDVEVRDDRFDDERLAPPECGSRPMDAEIGSDRVVIITPERSDDLEARYSGIGAATLTWNDASESLVNARTPREPTAIARSA